MTNADRIRSMSDEELAEFTLRGCDNILKGKDCYKYGRSCVPCIIEWLKKEVTDDNI